MSEQPVQPNPVGPPVTGAGYRCKVNADVWATIDRKTDTVFIWTRLTVYTPDDKSIIAPSGHVAQSPACSYPIPLKKFKSEEHIGEFVRAVRARFEAYGPLLISVQASMYLQGCVDLQDNETFSYHPVDVIDAPVLIAEHLLGTEYILGLVYGVEPAPAKQKRNGRARWTKAELEAALYEIGRSFPRRSRPTFQQATDELNKRYPERALKNGEVLRKLSDRLSVKAAGKFRNRGGNRNKNLAPVEASNRS